jgi:hypothetical protein
MLDSFYIAIILAGFGGGAVRSIVGYYKSSSFTFYFEKLFHKIFNFHLIYN